MISVKLYPTPQESEKSHGIAHQWDEESQQTQRREQHGQKHIHPIAHPLQAEEAPASWRLHLVGPLKQEGQQGHQQTQQPG